MGKRKLHGRVYYQCDWTAFPMRHSNCYMPTWKHGKLVKRGSYCDWAAVLAHATHMHDDDAMSTDEYEAVVRYLHGKLGPLPEPYELHYSFLSHFGGDPEIDAKLELSEPRDWDFAEYQKRCDTSARGPWEKTMVAEDGTVTTDTFVLTDSMPGELTKQKYAQGCTTEHTDAWGSRVMIRCTPTDTLHVRSTRRGPLNTIASTVCKMPIQGDAEFKMTRKVLGLTKYERFVHFGKEEFAKLCTKRKKRSQSFDADEFSVVKKRLQTDAAAVEAKMSASAQTPAVVATGAKHPPATGKELAAVAELKGCHA